MVYNKVPCWMVAVVLGAVVAGCSDDSLRIIGATCAKDDECTSGRCDELVCKTSNPLPPDAPCSSPFECASEVCVGVGGEARCGEGVRPLGAPCTRDPQCADGFCVANVCSGGDVDGSVTPSPDGGADMPSADASTPTDMAPGDASSSGLPTYQWETVFGDTAGREFGNDIAVDSQGNVYVVGFITGTANPGGGSVSSQGGADIVVTSFTPDGVHRWQRVIGSTGSDIAEGVAVDGSGNVYVVGKFAESVDLGGGVAGSAGVIHGFITSFSAAGAHRWQKVIGTRATEVAVDPDDNITVVGEFSDTVDLGGGNVASKGASDAFVTSFTAGGVHRWQRGFGGPDNDDAMGVTADPSGNVTLTGFFSSTAELGGGTETSRGSYDIHITSFTAAGVHRWQHALGGIGWDGGEGIVADSKGNVTIIGTMDDDVELGGGVIPASGNDDAFVTSFTSDGVHRWQHKLAGLMRDYGFSVAVDRSDNVFLTGYFGGLVDVGGAALLGSHGDSDIFLTSFTAAGAHRWQLALGGTGRDDGYAVQVDRFGNLYLTGNLENNGVDFGGGEVICPGQGDVFLVKYSL